jgi:8-oxo-dGTP pyrophosphatase MutT (NUDIX family)
MRAPTLPILRDESFRASLARTLGSFERRAHALADTHRHAAVALAVVAEGHGAAIDGLPEHASASARAALLLTRRSASLSSHPGQWALPGGRVEHGESPAAAALRELHEEVGLAVDPVHVLGCLDDYTTRSGFVITPVVVWAGAGDVLVPDPAEVASVHRIPVEEFLRADAPMLEVLPEHEQPVLRMPVGTTWIAAPTAAVLYQFRELCLLGRATRVAHFEQPRFAWR